MTNIIFIRIGLFLSLLFFDNNCNAAVIEVIDVKFNDLTIVSRAHKASLLEDAEDKDAVSSLATVDDLAERLTEVSSDGGGESGKKLHILSWAKTAMDDEAFAEVTESFLRKVNFEDDEGVLDLSFNGLTPASAPQLIRWIDEGGVKFINVHGNPRCSMRYIGELCKTLKVAVKGEGEESPKSEVGRIMSHIVFLPKYYIHQAKTRGLTYRQLRDKGYLPDDWDEVQRAFYRATAKGKSVSFSEMVFHQDPDADFPFVE